MIQQIMVLKHLKVKCGFGVREFAMGAAVNGMAAHGGLHPYGATFFVFEVIV